MRAVDGKQRIYLEWPYHRLDHRSLKRPRARHKVPHCAELASFMTFHCGLTSMRYKIEIL